jgi:serine protease Do
MMFRSLCRCLVFALVVLAACSIASPLIADDPQADPSAGELAVNDVQAGPRALSRAFRAAARKATPSVVTVLSYGQQLVPRGPQPALDQEEPPQQGSEQAEEPRPASPPDADAKQLTGLGSGVIVSADGRVITNNHVIAGAKRVVVQLPDQTEIEATEVRGDPDSDVATLLIALPEAFQCADLGNSDALEIGDWVLTIGSPFRLEATVSAGIISAKNRSLPRINRGRLIQTDAAINPGNSGGPMIDLDGRVVAISTAIATRNGGYQGIGFAIPINQAKWIAEELANHGHVRRAAIGIRMAELNAKIARKFNLPTGLGVLAYQIIENSAAQRAGIQPLDVILEFAGELVRDPGGLQQAVERQPVGSVQEVKILRKGEELIVKVELATVEDPTQSTSTSEPGREAEASPPVSPPQP